MFLESIAELVETIYAKDPATRSRIEIILCYPGVHALIFHSLAHQLWLGKFFLLARSVSQLGRFLTGIEIHPGAKIGHRVFIDHGMGVVVGETAEIGDDVVLYQGVTLGAGAQARLGEAYRGIKRHPTLRQGVIVGSGAEIQGPIEIGAMSRIASGSIVLKDIPPNSVVAGIPGRIIFQDGERVIPESNDLEAEAIKCLYDKLRKLEDLLPANQGKGASVHEQDKYNDPVEIFLNGAGI